ncbi:tol-pal system protein YbgF [Halovibrio salipaludis]|uniref:Cell division coordinator CpoB n=1 Tax=Halovibrio salipaludis TaxID=2032626 RepID=A0A2A2F4R5_9GAMM|nr:tol-pal system protein YbgF [Halovibrio salipaludis]
MRSLLKAGLILAVVGASPAIAQNEGEAPLVSGNNPERSGGNSAGELFFLVEELRAEVQHLRGQLEETSHQVKRLRQQARERYIDLDERLVDLDSRLSDLEESPEKTRSGENTSDSAEESSNSGSSGESTSYRQPDEAEREAYASIQYLIQEEQDYEAAIDEIYSFLEEYPEGDLSVNAYYWLGEVYLSQGKHEQAQQAFTIVTSRHASHRKAPDALFKLAVAHDRAGDGEQARSILDRLGERYPESEAAALGREYRNEMG